MLRRKGMQLGLRGALVGNSPRWWALTVLVPLLCGTVPIFLVNSVLRDVKGDVAKWQWQIAQLTDKVGVVVDAPVALLLRHCSRGFVAHVHPATRPVDTLEHWAPSTRLLDPVVAY
jgi:hypothetical protein